MTTPHAQTGQVQRLVKFPVLVSAGALVTLLLFYTMQWLILADYQTPSAEPSTKIANITMPELEFEVAITQPKPEKLEEPERPPAQDDLPVTGGTGNVIFVINPPVVETVDGFGDNIGFTDANAIPLIQVPPVYPQRALQREIEGYVVVEFDVDEAGMVINPRVLYAEPEGYFESAALRALERYRYQPKVVDGRQVKMFGVQQKLSFNLE